MEINKNGAPAEVVILNLSVYSTSINKYILYGYKCITFALI